MYTKKEVKEVLAAYVDLTGRTTRRHYREWLNVYYGPASSTVEKMYGGWTKAVTAALRVR
ncbi:hypothetical protein N8Z24_00105 [bacterium]|nr:hypothetical protein [bacterium]